MFTICDLTLYLPHQSINIIMTNKIIAKFKKGEIVDADSLPMCSFSERDEAFVINQGWEYTLPEGWQLFKDKPQKGDYAEVVGEISGKEVLIGYACPIVYVMFGNVYSTYRECYESPLFHPTAYQMCRLEDVEEVVARQEEMMQEGYGD